MAPWWQGPLYEFDLESTGTNTREDRIVQWCAALGAPGYEHQVMSGFVNPGIPIPQGAIDIHGITDEYARRYGTDPATGVELCASEVAGAIKARIPLTGHNLSYDFALLHWECVRNGLPTVLERTGGVIMPVFDLYVLDKEVDRYRGGKGCRKLGAVAAIYGVPLTQAHDAIADCHAATQCIRVIGERYPRIGNTGPMLLHTVQVDWRAQQCADLQHYFRTKAGKPEAYVDPCWPICLDLNHPTT